MKKLEMIRIVLAFCLVFSVALNVNFYLDYKALQKLYMACSFEDENSVDFEVKEQRHYDKTKTLLSEKEFNKTLKDNHE